MCTRMQATLAFGGWSPDLTFLWRVTRDDLERAGFDMKEINKVTSEPTSGTAEGLHINM